MRTSLLIAIAAVAALASGPVLAQEYHAAHHAADAKAGPAAHSMEGMDAAAMHEMCKAEMGKKMDPKAVHEHSREKSGIAVWPNGKPLTEAEMAKMHERCAAKMAMPMGDAPKM